MTARPTGTVTFLFTDIEGSTRLWDQDPGQMKDSLARHDRIVREAVAAQHGYVFSTAGDAFSVAFARPEQALEAALGAQIALAIQESTDHVQLSVRMAIHSGTASERDGDYFGPALNRCARLLAVANGGQVLLTEATHGMVKDHPPTGASFRDLGSHRLRDLSVSERVFALVHPDFASTQAIRSLSVLPNNLPVQLTTFVGGLRNSRRLPSSFVEVVCSQLLASADRGRPALRCKSRPKRWTITRMECGCAS
jgi:class 3 adenylate cyclase